MKIAILGAVHGTTKEEYEIFETYEKVCQRFFEDTLILTPKKIDDHRAEYKQKNPNATEKEIDADMVSFDLKAVSETENIFADVSYRSTGLGMELAFCFDKNVTLFYKEGTKYSNMVSGGFPNAQAIKYSNKQELEEKLVEILNKIK